MKEILAKAGLLGEKIAVAGVDGISIAALTEAGIETYSGHWIMQEARAVKTRDEQVCAKTVAAIADVGFWAIQEALKPGVRDIDVQAAAMAAMTKAGAVVTPNTIVVFSGPHGYPRGIPNTDRIIRPGDLVYVDIAGMKYMGYNSCIYRTYKVGCQPTAQEKSWMDRVVEKQNKAIDAIKPGNTSADVAACFSPCDELGYPTELDCLSMDICHGIGLISYEEPIINRLDSFNYPQEAAAGHGHRGRDHLRRKGRRRSQTGRHGHRDRGRMRDHRQNASRPHPGHPFLRLNASGALSFITCTSLGRQHY